MDFKFAIYAHQPKTVERLPLETIKQWAEENPSCINLWMIYCKKLLAENHPDFQEVLRKTAFYSPNRAQLHNYLYNESWHIHSDLYPEKEDIINPRPSKPLDTDVLANAVSNTILQEVSTFDIAEIEALPPLVNEQKETSNKTNELSTVDEDISFLAWLGTDDSQLNIVKAPSLTAKQHTEPPETKPDQTSENKKTSTENKPKESASKEELIKRFMELEPQITPKKVEMYNPINVAKKSTEENYSFVTETLAEIFLNQGQYEKAKKAYESLSLRIPEKKSYFADRLKKIDEKLQQKKTK